MVRSKQVEILRKVFFLRWLEKRVVARTFEVSLDDDIDIRRGVAIDDDIHTKKKPPSTRAKATKHSSKYKCELINLLSSAIAEHYYNWVRVGWCQTK